MRPLQGGSHGRKGHFDGWRQRRRHRHPAEAIGSVPLAYLDVLGMPVLDRILQRLQAIRHFADDADQRSSCRRGALFAQRSTCSVAPAASARHGASSFGRRRRNFSAHVPIRGAELVIVSRVGPYVEVDYEEMIQHHLEQRSSVVSGAIDADGAVPGTVPDQCLGSKRGRRYLFRKPSAAAAPGVVGDVPGTRLRQPPAKCRRSSPSWRWTALLETKCCLTRKARRSSRASGSASGRAFIAMPGS